ncbi:MAG: hypothetical protein ACK5V3_02190 [Bdellovibrionales bacterium]
MKITQFGLILIFGLISIQTWAAQVRTSSKVTEYFEKSKNSKALELKKITIQVGNKIDSDELTENTVQSAEIKLSAQASDKVIEAEIKSLAEMMGQFKILNTDEKRRSERICINRKNEKVCHSSIDFEFTTETQAKSKLERSASRRDSFL